MTNVLSTVPQSYTLRQLIVLCLLTGVAAGIDTPANIQGINALPGALLLIGLGLLLIIFLTRERPLLQSVVGIGAIIIGVYLHVIVVPKLAFFRTLFLLGGSFSILKSLKKKLR